MPPEKSEDWNIFKKELTNNLYKLKKEGNLNTEMCDLMLYMLNNCRIRIKNKEIEV